MIHARTTKKLNQDNALRAGQSPCSFFAYCGSGRRNRAWGVVLVFLLLAGHVLAAEPKKDLWLITAYCSCLSCCGKSDGITASGKKARPGYIALNWVPFRTRVSISGLGVYEVQDRGARSLFGTKKNPIKHIDIFFNTHAEALRFGKQYREVKIL